jgi:acyl-coenzyme A thioesterase PaaI-like protein
MKEKAFQDFYPDEFAHCFGCGRLNKDGLHLKSYWDGEESVCRYTPEPHFTGGFPGYMYGGLIASLMDCHAAGTASAAKLREEGLAPDGRPLSRYVTASLKVDFLKPTPMGKVLEVRGRIKEIKGRKTTVAVTLSAEGEVSARGELVLVQLPISKPQ